MKHLPSAFDATHDLAKAVDIDTQLGIPKDYVTLPSKSDAAQTWAKALHAELAAHPEVPFAPTQDHATPFWKQEHAKAMADYDNRIPVVQQMFWAPGQDPNAYLDGREPPGLLSMLARGFIQGHLGGDDAEKMKANWAAGGYGGGSRLPAGLMAQLNAFNGPIV